MIAPEPFFTPRGTPLSVYHRTATTAELGVEVDLLTYGQGQDVDLPGVRVVRIPAFRLLGEVPTGPSLLKLFLDGFLVVWALALLLRHRYQVVHAHEEAVFFCLALQPLFRFKLIYDMHSSLPQQLENFRFTRSRLWIGLFRWFEDRALSNADAVITICPSLAEQVLAHGVPDDRHFLIENSLLDPVRLSAEPSEEASDERILAALPAEARLLVYAGTLEAYQGVDLLLQAFAKLATQHPQAFLLVLGGSREQAARHAERARELGIAGRCHFAGRIPQEAARRCIARAALQVSPRSSGTNTPLKVYEQLASGVPLVATAIHSHTQVLSPDVAFLVEPEADALAAGLARALGEPEAARHKAEQARRLYEERYARARYVEKLGAVFGRLA